MFNSNTRLLYSFKFDLSRVLKAKSNGAVGPFIYEFLLVSNSNHMSPFSCYIAAPLKKVSSVTISKARWGNWGFITT